MRETCSRSNLRSSTRVLPKVGLSFRAIRCSVRDVTMMSSMCVAGMRETDPTDAVFQETTAGDLVRSQLLGDSRYRTGCPPPSHRTSLEPESEREIPMQRLSDKIGPFGRCSQAETTPIRDFGAHVAPKLVWDSFGSWLRTIRPGIPPLEFVVGNALRLTLPAPYFPKKRFPREIHR